MSNGSEKLEAMAFFLERIVVVNASHELDPLGVHFVALTLSG